MAVRAVILVTRGRADEDKCRTVDAGDHVVIGL